MDEVRDRYGPPPESVLNLAEYAADPPPADRMGLECARPGGSDRRLKVQAGRPGRPRSAPPPGQERVT